MRAAELEAWHELEPLSRQVAEATERVKAAVAARDEKLKVRACRVYRGRAWERCGASAHAQQPSHPLPRPAPKWWLLEMQTEMMGKLMELGDKFLGMFGMSTANFKTVKDPQTGSYSISFQQ